MAAGRKNTVPHEVPPILSGAALLKLVQEKVKQDLLDNAPKPKTMTRLTSRKAMLSTPSSPKEVVKPRTMPRLASRKIRKPPQ